MRDRFFNVVERLKMKLLKRLKSEVDVTDGWLCQVERA